MARRTRKATEPVGTHPTEFRGRNDKGSLRPADERYLSDEQLDDLDKYLLEETGPAAQQLVAKREALADLIDLLTDDQLERLGEPPTVDEVDRMPRAQYRELLDQLRAVIEQRDEKGADA